ncbi:rab5, putative [Entamoeba invadens IP1]|uniref:Rab5, putative n=1 Tax=Entamoeba invadens IP1 TaxID=370355 RepID=A0A0A1U2F4_ENTIV|nr:rab5, putative [Entamoeba invadens IP1]ELP85708.1 rab5, putative [Entamoeba invadens IP1]|eukprot:XP_004185054.1 rab5, putative [Entamoeba invadens IP1]
MDDYKGPIEKFVLLGDTNTGKTVTLTGIRGDLNTNTINTIGAAFTTKWFYVDRMFVKAQFWDTAGVERYRSLLPMYYRGANATIFFYSVNKKESFQLLDRLVNEVKNMTQNGNYMKYIICGTRINLTSLRVVSINEAKKFAEENGCVYVEIGEQVDSLTNILRKTEIPQNKNVLLWVTSICKSMDQSNAKPTNYYFALEL